MNGDTKNIKPILSDRQSEERARPTLLSKFIQMRFSKQEHRSKVLFALPLVCFFGVPT